MLVFTTFLQMLRNVETIKDANDQESFKLIKSEADGQIVVCWSVPVVTDKACAVLW